MNRRFISKPCRLLAALALSPALWLAGVACAQTPPAAAPTAGAFRSALEGYQPYTEEKTINWKEANDVTARIGGWRAYAREAQQAYPANAPPTSAPAKAKP